MTIYRKENYHFAANSKTGRYIGTPPIVNRLLRVVSQSMEFKQQYTGTLTTTFVWLIPPILMVSRSVINPGAVVYALHITPLFEIGFNWRTKGKN